MKISVIIPTQNRALLLLQTLDSIRNQSSLTDVEVIVIDNGSTDDTATIAKSFAAKLPNFAYEYDAIPGLLTGRHRGIELAKGEILCFLDDDVILNPNYLASLKKAFEDKNVHFATGPCLPKYESKPPTWLKYFWDEVPEGKFCAWLSLLDFGKDQKTISPLFVFGLNFCCRKETAITLGGFHPDCIPRSLQQFQGDGETGLTFKAIDHNLTASYEPGLMLEHDVPKDRLTMAYFEKRAFYQGVCNSYTNLRIQELVKKHQVDEPISKLKILRNKLHPYYRWIKNVKAYLASKPYVPSVIVEMRETFAKAEQEGYKFHQQAFKQNEKVRNWVLKENYWDYKLPTND